MLNTRKFLGALLTVVLATGIAWAMESQSVSVPAGNSYTVTAVVVPGSGGAEVLGLGEGMGDDSVIFSIGFGDDLQLSINGFVLNGFNPVAQHTVTIDCELVNGDWVADITVVDDSLSVIVGQELGYDMSAAATKVTAKADDVVSLSAE